MKRIILAVSMGHREWSRQQATTLQVFGLGLILAIVLAELGQPSVTRQELVRWVGISLALMATRSVLYVVSFKVEPEKMAGAGVMRLFPVLGSLFGFPLWGFTSWTFASHGFTPTMMVVFVGYLLLSGPTAALWSSAPLIVVIWILAGWGSFFWFAYSGGALHWDVILILCCGIAAIFYSKIVLQTRSIGKLLDRSDQVDLLVASLSETNQQLREANAELDKLKREAERVLAARSTFFATASHDLKQRLHAAKLLSNTLVDAPRIAPDATGLLRQLAATIDDVEQLSAQALEFARFERLFEGVQPPHDRAAVSLQRLFQELAVALDASAELTKVDLRFRVTDAVVISDRHLLGRIVENLIQNALRFSRDRVLVGTRRRGAGLVIQVWDRGPGIEPGSLQHIFEPFFQGQQCSGSPRGHRGYGLGLATVQRFAQVLGMSVSVRSWVGRGSVFEIHVPSTLVPGISPGPAGSDPSTGQTPTT